jgi:hypothetical protein
MSEHRGQKLWRNLLNHLADYNRGSVFSLSTNFKNQKCPDRDLANHVQSKSDPVICFDLGNDIDRI